MSIPHVCPNCNGEGSVFRVPFGAISTFVQRECPTCNGKGVLWEPGTSEDTKRIWQILTEEDGV